MTAIAAPTAALPAAPTPAGGGKAPADGFDALLAIAGRSDSAPVSPRPTPARADAKADDRGDDRDTKAVDKPTRAKTAPDTRSADAADQAHEARSDRAETVSDTVDKRDVDSAQTAQADAPSDEETSADGREAADGHEAEAQAAATLIAAMTAPSTLVTGGASDVEVQSTVEGEGPAVVQASATAVVAETMAASTTPLTTNPVNAAPSAAPQVSQVAGANPQMAAGAPAASTPETVETASAIPAPVADLATARSAEAASGPAAQTQSSTVLEALAQLSTEQATATSPTAPTPTPTPIRTAANPGQTVSTPQLDSPTGVAPPAEAQAPIQTVSPAAPASTTAVAVDTPATATAMTTESPGVTVAAEAVSAAVATASETKGDSKPAESVKLSTPAAVAVAAQDAVAVETAGAVTAASAGSATTGGETGGQNTGTEAGADKGVAALATVEAPILADPTAEPTPAAPAAPVLQAAATSTSSAVPAPVRGSPETVAALSAEIVKKADAKTTRFDVALTPDGLGKVDVRIEIGRDGALTASMRFDTVHAAQELRGKAHELRQALADAGFNVADNALSFDVSSQGGQSQNPFFAFEGWGDQGQRAFPGRAFQAALTGEDDITITPELLPGLKTVADSGLDIRI